jgi:hypothetical protein
LAASCPSWARGEYKSGLLECQIGRPGRNPESFDVIWPEGALNLMGFETGLKTCRPVLKRKGYLAVTELVWLSGQPSPEAREWAKEYESIKNMPDNLLLFKGSGYDLVGHFTLPVSSRNAGGKSLCPRRG